MSSQIAVSCANSMMEIRFTRPDRRNALTAEMSGLAADAITLFNRKGDLRALVFSSEGTDFCIDTDADELLGFYNLGGGSPWRRFQEALVGIRKPVISAVQGHAIGMGLTIALHSDFVYAEPDAVFSAPFVKSGLVPQMAASVMLPRRVGPLRAMEVFALGRTIEAAEAVEWHIATAVTDHGASRRSAMDTASKLVELNPDAWVQTKRLVAESVANNIGRIKLESDIFVGLLSTPQTRESLIGGLGSGEVEALRQSAR